MAEWLDASLRREFERYGARVADRWPLQRLLIGGARVADARGAKSKRERGPEWVAVLVSEHFDGIPWLERVHQAASLWDSAELGGAADIHCYTPVEFERKIVTLPRVTETVRTGVEVPVGSR